jgi:hypothetical protein
MAARNERAEHEPSNLEQLLRRRVSRRRFCKGLRWMRRPAQFVDRFLNPRLEIVTKRGGLYGVALLCSVIGIVMPSLEVVPFSAHIVGLALHSVSRSSLATV